MASKELIIVPDEAKAIYVFGHGAGAGMRHEFMEDMARRLAAVQVATLRYEFPYMAAGRKRIDSERVLFETIANALDTAREKARGLPLFAGGKSMGGRMTSRFLASHPDESVRGLIFFGFPLHPPKKPSTERADHLEKVNLPMLFLQGTRDDLADINLITQVAAQLGPRARLHIVEGADHSFGVLKKSGRTNEEVRSELAAAAAAFVAGQAI